jgi:hypothetical protein
VSFQTQTKRKPSKPMQHLQKIQSRLSTSQKIIIKNPFANQSPEPLSGRTHKLSTSRTVCHFVQNIVNQTLIAQNLNVILQAEFVHVNLPQYNNNYTVSKKTPDSFVLLEKP